MVAANYVSYIVGALFYDAMPAPRITLDNYYVMIALLVFGFYLLTILVEFPFVSLLYWRTSRRWFKALSACVVIQAVSYAGLVYYYSHTTRDDFGGHHIVALERMDLPDDIVVYYLDDDGTVYRQRLGSAERSSIASIHPEYVRLKAVRLMNGDLYRWNLYAEYNGAGHEATKLVVELPEKAKGPLAEKCGPDMSWNAAPRLAGMSNSRWCFTAKAQGQLAGLEDKTRYREWGMETLFVYWWVDNVTQLPNDTLLLQLGKDMICLFDPETEQVALVTYGRGPVAILEEAGARGADEGAGSRPGLSGSATKLATIRADEL